MNPRPLIATGIAVALATTMTGLAIAASTERLSAERVESLQVTPDLGLPVLTSDNVHYQGTDPDTLGISGCFAKTAPYFYVSSLDSISVYDASDPLQPRRVGVLDNIVFENEAMNCGERRGPNGEVERFVLVGNNLYDYSSSDPDGSMDSTLKDELIVVDVTDPTDPHIRSRVETTTGDHTVTCVVDTACEVAYSSGGRNSFSVIDLRDLDAPVEVDAEPATAGVQPFRTPTGGHKWNFDEAGFGTHTGYAGSGIFDASDPFEPRLVTTTGAAGDRDSQGAENGYNNFIHHNSFRPNADAFVADAPPSVDNGNVLLVTEEDYEDTDCSTAGSFQTWHVKRLDGTPGAIEPLDKVELADLGSFPSPHGGFCSAHWFDYHQSGVVAIGYYGGGTQLVDVTEATEITPYGHAVAGASEVWDSYWVPVYNKNGTATGRKSNVLYSVDLVRGLDVHTVDLP